MALFLTWLSKTDILLLKDLWQAHVSTLYIFAVHVLFHGASIHLKFQTWQLLTPAFLSKFDTLPTCHSIFKRFPLYLLLLFPRPVGPAMSPVLRCSLVDFDSWEGRESEWGTAGKPGVVSPLNTKSTGNVKCLKSNLAKCPIHKLNFGLWRTLNPSCTHGRHWRIVTVEDRGACPCFFKGISATILLLLGLLIGLNIISIRIKEAESPIHLSKCLFKLVAFENPFKFKLQS